MAIHTTETADDVASAQTWGGWLRSFRQQLGMSQDELVDHILFVCAHLSSTDARRFKQIRLECPKVLAGNEISRYETGKRLPLDRSFHLLLLCVFIQSGVSLTVEQANAWLELGRQGWLTDNERRELFP